MGLTAAGCLHGLRCTGGFRSRAPTFIAGRERAVCGTWRHRATEFKQLVQRIAERIGYSLKRSGLITRDVNNAYLAFERAQVHRRSIAGARQERVSPRSDPLVEVSEDRTHQMLYGRVCLAGS